MVDSAADSARTQTVTCAWTKTNMRQQLTLYAVIFAVKSQKTRGKSAEFGWIQRHAGLHYRGSEASQLCKTK